MDDLSHEDLAALSNPAFAGGTDMQMRLRRVLAGVDTLMKERDLALVGEAAAVSVVDHLANLFPDANPAQQDAPTDAELISIAERCGLGSTIAVEYGRALLAKYAPAQDAEQPSGNPGGLDAQGDERAEAEVELCRYCDLPVEAPGYCGCNGACYAREHRAALSRQPSAGDAELSPDDLELFARTYEHFDDGADTTTDAADLMRFARVGLLECAHFTVTAKGEAMYAARAQRADKGQP